MFSSADMQQPADSKIKLGVTRRRTLNTLGLSFLHVGERARQAELCTIKLLYQRVWGELPCWCTYLAGGGTQIKKGYVCIQMNTIERDV